MCPPGQVPVQVLTAQAGSMPSAGRAWSGPQCHQLASILALSVPPSLALLLSRPLVARSPGKQCRDREGLGPLTQVLSPLRSPWLADRKQSHSPAAWGDSCSRWGDWGKVAAEGLTSWAVGNPLDTAKHLAGAQICRQIRKEAQSTLGLALGPLRVGVSVAPSHELHLPFACLSLLWGWQRRKTMTAGVRGCLWQGVGD